MTTGVCWFGRAGRIGRDIGVLTVTLLGCISCGSHSAEKSSPASESAQAPPVQQSLKKNNLTYADRQAWRQVMKWSQSCESLFHYPDTSFAGLQFFQLGSKQYLVQITCELGAYQGTYVFYVWDETRAPPTAQLLTFAYYQGSRSATSQQLQLVKKATTELEGTPQFDPSTHELEVVFKYRGRGDCGIRYKYSLTGKGVELVDTRAKLACDGKGSSPREWRKVIPD